MGRQSLVSLREKLQVAVWVPMFLASTVAVAEASDVTPRLTIKSACSEPIWIFHTVGEGGGTLNADNPIKLDNSGDAYSFDIPDKGLAGTRFWPGMQCDETGSNCRIGQSGGPGLPCPDKGCAPPIDSKFEGTFGCLPSVAAGDCQRNPSSPNGEQPLPRTDSWDTSMVDGFTLPYKVTVQGTCPNGPTSNTIDCSKLALSHCPGKEMINGLATNLILDYPKTTEIVGCYSPCSKLTMSNWDNSPTYAPTSEQAKDYCCAGITPQECQNRIGARSQYVKNIHKHCPQTYAYAYDDENGLFDCPAAQSTRYTVTFYCPQ